MTKVISVSVTNMQRLHPPDPARGSINLLVVDAAKPKAVTLNHIPHRWAFRAKNIRVKGGLVLKGNTFKIPGDKRRVPHEVKRWRVVEDIEATLESGLRLMPEIKRPWRGGAPTAGDFHTHVVEPSKEHIWPDDVSLELELNNGQRVYVSPKGEGLLRTYCPQLYE